MTAAASWMRKNGARRLTAIMRSSLAPSRCASTMSKSLDLATLFRRSGIAIWLSGPCAARNLSGACSNAGEIKTMRVGLLGAGRIGRIHAGNIGVHKRAKLVSVADPDATSAQAVAGATDASVKSADAILSAPDIYA